MKTKSRRLLALLFLISTFTLALSTLAHAQNVPKFKEGDKVEVDSRQASTADMAVWRKGTVIKVDLALVAYVIQIDPLPGEYTKTMLIPIRPYAEKWIRNGEDAGSQKQADDGGGKNANDAHSPSAGNQPQTPSDPPAAPASEATGDQGSGTAGPSNSSGPGATTSSEKPPSDTDSKTSTTPSTNEGNAPIANKKGFLEKLNTMMDKASSKLNDVNAEVNKNAPKAKTAQATQAVQSVRTEAVQTAHSLKATGQAVTSQGPANASANAEGQAATQAQTNGATEDSGAANAAPVPNGNVPPAKENAKQGSNKDSASKKQSGSTSKP